MWIRHRAAVSTSIAPMACDSLGPNAGVLRVESLIAVVRGQRVMLDRDLAQLYGVATKELNQSVRRNSERFPPDFRFELSSEEHAALVPRRSERGGRGGSRYRIHAFTEQGVAMLSSVLRSSRAIAVNIEIMRAFARFRRWIHEHEELARRIAELERQFLGRSEEHDEHIARIYALIDELTRRDDSGRDERIGFRSEMGSDRSKSEVLSKPCG